MRKSKIATGLTYILVVCALLSTSAASAQQKYTVYDELPGVPKAYKPGYDATFPTWASMLYEDAIDLSLLDKEYAQWESTGDTGFRAIRRYYLLWREAIRPFVRPNGSITVTETDQAILSGAARAATSVIRDCAAADAPTWTFAGPKETFWMTQPGNRYSGACSWQVNVYSLDVAPSDENILYCGTETGYLNKSVNKGKSWTPIALDYIFGRGIKAVAIDPLDPEIVFVSAGLFIHKSVDGGHTWSKTYQFSNNGAPERIAISRSNPDIIVASSMDGIFVSNDKGATWRQRWGLPTYDAHFVGDGTIYGISEGANEEVIVCLSEDSGVTFVQDASFPKDVTNSAGLLLAAAEQDPQHLFAMILGPQNTPLLYQKNLSSGRWDLLAEGRSLQLQLDNGQGYYDMVLEVDPRDERILYAGTTSLFQTTDGGATWRGIGGYLGDFPIHPDMQDMRILPSGDLWIATDGGLTLSTDHFGSPDNASALNKGCLGSDMWGFDMGWNEDIVVGGRYHNGNMAIGEMYDSSSLRIGGAESPTGWILNGKSRHAVFDDLGGGWILPKDKESPPGQRFVFSRYPNMDEFGGRRSNLVQHPWYYEHIYLGEGNGIWLSHDFGATFQLLHDFGARVRYFTISHKNPDVLYADIVNQGLWTSKDGGITWIHLTNVTEPPYLTNQGGRLFIAVSPSDENRLYVCLQNGFFSSDIGRILSSEDGGTTWNDITDGQRLYTKMLVVQPDDNGEDIVYLFADSRFQNKAEILVRRTAVDTAWSEYSCGLPAHFQFVFAQPFYRDGKLRIAGNAGVWEAPLYEQNHMPLLTPWVAAEKVACVLDTIQFEDHSIIPHNGNSWSWEISPEPSYISDPSARNPKVVFGQSQRYDIGLMIANKDTAYHKRLAGLVQVSQCPSIQDCNNPALIPQQDMAILYVSSEELLDGGDAVHAIDGDINTIWHTTYFFMEDTYPHELHIDLGDRYELSEFVYQPRTQGLNGIIKDYELYVSDDPQDWGEPIIVDALESSSAKKVVPLDMPTGRYVRLRALSEINGQNWASAAEIEFRGCLATTTSLDPDLSTLVKVFPVPSKDYFSVPLPHYGGFSYQVSDIKGSIILQGSVAKDRDIFRLDLSPFMDGIYLLSLIDPHGVVYHAKLLKNGG